MGRPTSIAPDGGAPAWPRTIVHADMDAFYAAVEQLDDPSLRGRPVLVGPRSARGVVLTASYEARPFRVGSAMPMALARRRCPEAVVVPPRFERYAEISAQVMAVFADFSPAVEPISLDEAFLDMSGSEHIFGPPAAMGLRLREAVREATGGLSVSVGIAGTKFVAKVASGHGKPEGLTIVPPMESADWLAPLPVSVLWGAGPKTQARLRALGLDTVGDLALKAPAWLETQLGRSGLHFHALALGDDPRPVRASRLARSLSSERTLERDISDADSVLYHLRKAAEQVGRRLRRRGWRAGGVRVKLKHSDFSIVTRQLRLRQPTDASATLLAAAESLLSSFDPLGSIRLVGLAAYDLAEADTPAQLDFTVGASERERRLDDVLDAVERRFGAGTLHRARELQGENVIEGVVTLDFLDADERDGS